MIRRNFFVALNFFFCCFLIFEMLITHVGHRMSLKEWNVLLKERNKFSLYERPFINLTNNILKFAYKNKQVLGIHRRFSICSSDTLSLITPIIRQQRIDSCKWWILMKVLTFYVRHFSLKLFMNFTYFIWWWGRCGLSCLFPKQNCQHPLK